MSDVRVAPESTFHSSGTFFLLPDCGEIYFIVSYNARDSTAFCDCYFPGSFNRLGLRRSRDHLMDYLNY